MALLEYLKLKSLPCQIRKGLYNISAHVRYQMHRRSKQRGFIGRLRVSAGRASLYEIVALSYTPDRETFPAKGVLSCNRKSFPPRKFCCIRYCTPVTYKTTTYHIWESSDFIMSSSSFISSKTLPVSYQSSGISTFSYISYSQHYQLYTNHF